MEIIKVISYFPVEFHQAQLKLVLVAKNPLSTSYQVERLEMKP